MAPDGAAYTLTKIDGQDKIEVSQNTITAISVAASVGASYGGTTGVALSGAGASATNVILTGTNAYIQDSDVNSGAKATLLAQSTSDILATVVAATIAGTYGGTTGVAASIGAAIANNYIGYDSDGNSSNATIQAYIEDSDITTTGALSQSALAGQSISAIVFAGSVAIGAGGTTGVGASGSGVSAENKDRR